MSEQKIELYDGPAGGWGALKSVAHHLHEQGVASARLYGNDPGDGVGGDGAFFLLLDDPEVYGLPPDPVVTTKDLPDMWKRAGLAALAMATSVVVAFLGRHR